MQKSGDAVRVNIQLIKAAHDSHLWADTFDRKLTDIFSVESEVAKAIVDQLRVKLTGEDEQIIAAKPTDNPEVYDAYLRGLAFEARSSYSIDLLEKATGFYERAARNILFNKAYEDNKGFQLRETRILFPLLSSV